MLSAQLFNCVLEYAIREVQENEGLNSMVNITF
jgi:hypothetical protein